MSRSVVSVLCLALGMACAHPATSPSTPHDRNMLTKQELDARHFSTLYDAIEGMRGVWLRNHGDNSFAAPTQVKVYLDNVLVGGVDNLRNIAPTSVSYVQYIDGITASNRWGLDHGSGVIFVATRPTPIPPR